MTHPLIPKILDLATPVAQDLDLEIAGAVFQTNQHPPVLRIDIRNPRQGTSLNDCEAMSRALEATLDASDLIPDAYVLEVSSPGISETLTSDRDFAAFKGFSVTVTTTEPYKGQTTWNGRLVRRDDETLQIRDRGRSISIPRSIVASVRLD
ncbi:MAG: ribosome maturation factor RimP [Cyanobacteria bacterium SID2]|nr:ribosome maturation factor RimP [Cyanobacteria bacterium SID2]MBP0006116.1 ribosome maturation factor RimP [Cyanobacteria bacterium SBC]